MREAVEKVLHAESDAKRIVAEAEQQAQTLMSEAQKAGKACVDTARQNAETKAAALIQAAAANADEERKRILEEAKIAAARFIEQSSHVPDSVVEFFARKTGGLEL